MVDVDDLILFCPAAYSVASWALPFGGGFTQEIRRPNSFLDTDAAEVCGRFRGRVLVVYGDQDEVIPPAVQRLYAQAFVHAQSVTRVEIPGCPHPIHRWLQHRPLEKQRLLTQVGEFLTARTSPNGTSPRTRSAPWASRSTTTEPPTPSGPGSTGTPSNSNSPNGTSTSS